ADGIGHILIALIAIGYGTHGHNFYVISNAAHAYIVFAVCGNNTRYVCSVFSIGAFYIVITVILFIHVVVVIAYNGARIKFQIIPKERLHTVVVNSTLQIF